MAVGSNLVAATSASDITSVLSQEFLHIHATTESKFTLKCICNIIKTHSLLVTLAVLLSTFTLIHVNFLLKRYITRGHRISYTYYHIERTDNKPFSGLIGPRHATTSWAVAHQSWVARCSPHIL